MGADNTSATDWDDFTNGDPISDLMTAAGAHQRRDRLRANTLVVGDCPPGFDESPHVLGRLKYVMAGSQANIRQSLMGILGIENYPLPGQSLQHQRSGGFSATPVIDDDALLLYVSPNAGTMGLSAAKRLFRGAWRR